MRTTTCLMSRNEPRRACPWARTRRTLGGISAAAAAVNPAARFNSRRRVRAVVAIRESGLKVFSTVLLTRLIRKRPRIDHSTGNNDGGNSCGSTVTSAARIGIQNDADSSGRPAIRISTAAAVARIHYNCHPRAGPGDRCEYGYFFYFGCRVVAAAAVCRSGSRGE